MDVLGSVRKPQGAKPSFVRNAFRRPVLGLGLYSTLQRMATTTMDVMLGLK